MSVRPVPDDGDREGSVERWVESFGAKWALREVAVDLIDTQRSRRNQARVGGLLDEVHLSRLVEQARRGTTFPPVVAYSVRSGLVLIDGNHRHEACVQTDRKRIWVYEVDAEPETLAAMTASANAVLNGKPASAEDVTAHVIQQAAAGVEHAELARQFGRTKSEISRILRRERALVRARDLSVERPARALSTDNLINAATVRSDAAYAKIVTFLAEDLMSPGLVQRRTRLVKAARAHEGDDARAVAAVVTEIDAINDETKQRRAGGARVANPLAQPLRMVHAHLGYLAVMNPAEIVDLARRHPEHETKLRVLVADASKNLAGLRAGLDVF